MGGTTRHKVEYAQKHGDTEKRPCKIKEGNYVIAVQNKDKNSAFAERARAGRCITWCWLKGKFGANTSKVMESLTYNSKPEWIKTYGDFVQNDLKIPNALKKL